MSRVHRFFCAMFIVGGCADSSGPQGETGATSVLLPSLQPLPMLGMVTATVRDQDGRLVAGARVIGGAVRARDSHSPTPCDDPLPGLLSYAQKLTNADGRATIAVGATGGDERADCVFLFADRRDTAATVGEPLTGFAEWRAVSLPARANDSVRVELTMRAVAPPANLRRPDDEWAALARGSVPGFAGLYLEGCKLIVRVTNPEVNGNAARAYAASIPVPTGTCASNQIEIRGADYDFAELRRFSDRLFAIFSVAGVHSFDLDEVRNRVAIGVYSRDALHRVARATMESGVPSGAVLVDITQLGPPQLFGPARERWGTRLANNKSTASPVWRPGTHEILFAETQSTAVMVHAVDADTRLVRTVTSVPALNTGHRVLRATPDGHSVFLGVTAPDDRKNVIYKAATDGTSLPMVVLRGLEWYGVTVSADGRRFAVSWSSTSGPAPSHVFGIVEPATSRRIAILNSAPHTGYTFSPDGAALLFFRRGALAEQGVWQFSITDSSARRLLPIVEYDEKQRVLEVRWDSAGPAALLAERDRDVSRLVRVDLDKGTRTVLGTMTPGAAVIPQGSWAAGRVAVWLPVARTTYLCRGVCIGMLQYLTHWQLRVFGAGLKESVVLAEMATVATPGWTSLSADGRAVAYLMEGRLYVQPVAP